MEEEKNVVIRKLVELVTNQFRTRTEIAQVLSLPLPQVTNLCHELIQKNILIADNENESLLSFNAAAGLVGAIDFSTDNILVCISDLSGRILGRKALRKAYIITESMLYEALQVLRELCEQDNTFGIELLTLYIAAPGRVNEKTGQFVESYRFANATSLDLAQFFNTEFHCRVVIRNDVKLSIEGELQYGKLELSTQNALMLYANASVGCAILLNGQIYEGNHGFAGALENYILDIDTNMQYETLSFSLSLPGMVKRLNKELSKHPESKLLKEDTLSADTADLLRGFREHDPICQGILRHTAQILANLLYNQCEFLDIETVILNGGLTSFGAEFLEYINAELASHLLTTPIQVSYSILKERAAIVGALLLGRKDAMQILFKTC